MILADSDPRILARNPMGPPKIRSRYKADLQRVGTIISESVAILSQYCRSGNWDLVRTQVRSTNLIVKGSTNTLDGILTSIHRRYITHNPPLPGARLLGKYLVTDIPRRAKSQVLYAYICGSDALVKDTILELVRPRVIASTNPIITKHSIKEFLDIQSKEHPELNDWSDYLKQRWIRGFLALLRDFGLMHEPPNYDVILPVIRVEAFMFLLQGLLDAGLPPTAVINHEIWKLYLLGQKEIESLIVESQTKSLLQY
jgi:hypothetical protein